MTIRSLITVTAILGLCACADNNVKTDEPARTSAQDIKSAAEATKTPSEIISLKTPVTKVVITNTTGTTAINNGASVGEASLNISKIRTSDICEFKQEQKGTQLYVSVRNRGFTGAGDCEINLELSIPAATEVNVVSTSGEVALNLPKDTQPQVEFQTKTGQMISEFKNNKKGEPRITVRTQSGNLSIKAL
jgi:hypothetical protein